MLPPGAAASALRRAADTWRDAQRPYLPQYATFDKRDAVRKNREFPAIVGWFNPLASANMWHTVSL